MTDSTPDIDLPPGEATLLCQCGFESEPFCFVEHLYRCRRCRTIDRPSPIPFVYQPPACSRCGVQFERGDRVHVAWMQPAFFWSERNTNASADFVGCPRCDKNTLGLNSFCVHYQITENDFVVPSIGDTLHTSTMKCSGLPFGFFLWSPRLASEYALSLNVLNRQLDAIDDGHHEFKVVAISDTHPRITLEYVRQLLPEEWEWYIGSREVAT